ncbi:MAG: DUF4886 domain-containing protein [Tannerella sp.]|jgi:hypothetical protein|nr:DUF4886 domain-containing protein [Tannerella sp.]
MKKTAFLLFIIVISLCQYTNSQTITDFKNQPVPKYPATLKVLGIGNSFTDDGMEYLPDMLNAAGIKNVTLGKISLGGCSLERHDTLFVTGDTLYKYNKSYSGKNRWETERQHCALSYAIADEAWDIIVIQQASPFSGLYETYQPYLKRLITSILTTCPNAGVTLAWQMTWAYGSASTHTGFANYNKDQNTMYQAIIQAVKTMISETGIDLIIPSATTIQNLRASEINNPPADLTRDGYHIDFGAGRYALACTWFQSVIAPSLGITIQGNAFRTAKGAVPVDDRIAGICQKAAQQACSQQFKPIITN